MAAYHPKTQEELDIVERYGGEMLFTPGDIVYSSSALIETGPPDISIDKLLMLMDAEGLNFGDLQQTLRRCCGIAVHVIGDTIVDSLTYTTMIGGMTKTPTPSVRFDSSQDYIGGAAIVAAHLSAAGAEVTFSTVLGDDPLKDFVLDGLKRAGVKVQAIIDRTRPTTHKNTIVCGDYRLLKVDTLDNRIDFRSHRRQHSRAGRANSKRYCGVQRFSPRFIQSPDDTKADQRVADWRFQGRRQSGQPVGGATSSILGALI